MAPALLSFSAFFPRRPLRRGVRTALIPEGDDVTHAVHDEAFPQQLYRPTDAALGIAAGGQHISLERPLAQGLARARDGSGF